MLWYLLRLLERLSAYLCIGGILAIRALLGPACCRYPVGCTAYSIEQLKTVRMHRALWNITKRIVSCNVLGAWCR